MWLVYRSILEWVLLVSWMALHCKITENWLESRMHIPSRNARYLSQSKGADLFLMHWRIFNVKRHFMLFVSWRFKIKCHWYLIRYCNFLNFTCLLYCRLCFSSNNFFENLDWHSFQCKYAGADDSRFYVNQNSSWNIIRFA